MRPRLVVAAAIVLTACVTVAAQGQASAVEPGTRVRLTLPCAQTGHPAGGEGSDACRVEGTFVTWRPDTITLAVAESPISYRLSPRSRLEVHRGRRSHALVGAGAGFLVGGGTMLALLSGTGSTAPCDQSANQDAIETHRALGGFGYQVTMVGVSALVWTLILLSPAMAVRLLRRLVRVDSRGP
jgi:hypothetical protein